MVFKLFKFVKYIYLKFSLWYLLWIEIIFDELYDLNRTKKKTILIERNKDTIIIE